MSYKTSYSSDCEESFKWLASVKTDRYSAHCKVCNKSFRIDGGGLSQVRIHARGKAHEKNESIYNGQRTFSASKNRTLAVNALPSEAVLSVEELFTKAEILQALKTVESNYSFSCADGDNERFVLMFRDSEIAKSYRQSSTKIAYVIQHGIAPYLFDSIIVNIKDKRFSFMFDETTTSQVKKQFDGYVRFWSNDQVETSYCGSLFMGHCSADQMVDHFLDFKKRLNWDNSLMLHLGMDGNHLNKSFQKKLSKKLEENNNQFLNIGSCNLHKFIMIFEKI